MKTVAEPGAWPQTVARRKVIDALRRPAWVRAASRIAGESPYATIGGAIEVRMTSAFPKPAP